MKKNLGVILFIIALAIFLVTFLIISLMNQKNIPSEFEKAKNDAQIGNFSRFSNLIVNNDSSSLNNIKEILFSKNYSERQFYNVFNELSFKSTTPEVDCIERMKTPQCIFFSAILTSNEALCNNFPEEKQEEIPGKYGSSHTIAYYKDSCILYTRIHKIYLDNDNKTKFCNSFKEDYIKEACNFYTLTPQRDFSRFY